MEWNLKYVRVSGDWSSNGISRMDRRGVSSAFVRWMRLGMHVPTNWQNPNMHFQIECNFLYLLVPKFLASLYRNGFEALRKILGVDGPRGFYRGFGVSIVTYVPSNAVWWASYSMVVVVTLILDAIPRYHISVSVSYSMFVLVSIFHKLQVLDSEEINGRRRSLTLVQVVRNSVKKVGILGCYKGLGPRWASMSMSAATMITTYEFLKRVSAKNLDRLTV
ncbi:hypothetical protein JHK87_039328 [Glycine soja]|nr:hypothetical protein JHK87_039328 [Glycine soja]